MRVHSQLNIDNIQAGTVVLETLTDHVYLSVVEPPLQTIGVVDDCTVRLHLNGLALRLHRGHSHNFCVRALTHFGEACMSRKV
jgi:hypothetical protein